jgi:hypothetical protein
MSSPKIFTIKSEVGNRLSVSQYTATTKVKEYHLNYEIKYTHIIKKMGMGICTTSINFVTILKQHFNSHSYLIQGDSRL